VAEARFDLGAIYSAGYERDRLGRIVRKDEVIQGERRSFEYGYDLAGRLVEVVERRRPDEWNCAGRHDGWWRSRAVKAGFLMKSWNHWVLIAVIMSVIGLVAAVVTVILLMKMG
jgi:YD repeat-containing protein